ncbi:hypothetical protein [Legionella maioricensis]|uniref:Uncharacterized protein n=1 Tax=Legionella maioricensis TaxID=2896528 RepID=A0A9X2ID47_9GAMM|nr:hypothetical protein [Legionella maioricensis]MCL9684398.1 hypothetical protein [Legionella maioricensis]MCL9687579.1 hypothetical protein [Legionella maioricensis]
MANPHFTIFEIAYNDIGIKNIFELNKVKNDDIVKAIEEQKYTWRLDLDFESREKLSTYMSSGITFPARTLSLCVEYNENEKGEFNIVSYDLAELGTPAVYPSAPLNHKMKEFKIKQEEQAQQRHISHEKMQKDGNDIKEKMKPVYVESRFTHFGKEKKQNQIVFPKMSSEDSHEKLKENSQCNWLLKEGTLPGTLIIEFLDGRDNFQSVTCAYDKKGGWVIGDEGMKNLTTLLRTSNENFLSRTEFFQQVKEKFQLDETSMLKPEEQLGQIITPKNL